MPSAFLCSSTSSAQLVLSGMPLSGLQKEGDYCLGVDWIAARNNNGLQEAEEREQ